MHRWVVVLSALLLIAGCAVASAQGAETLQERYSHIQDLNNASSDLVYHGSGDKAQLHQALTKLKQAKKAIAQLQSELATESWLAAQVRWRNQDNLRMRADAYAQLGNKKAALDRLEAWVATGVSPRQKRWLLTDKYLGGLRDEPRFKALASRMNAAASRWNADAFMTPSDKLTEAQRIAGLSLFWSEARYNFVHFDHVPNLDWNHAYLDFLPRVIGAKNLHDYYDVLMRFAPLLHDSHTDIYPPKSIQNQFYARPPIRTALVENRVVVTWVADPCVAAKGIHVGDEIVSIDGQEVHQYAKAHVEPYASSSTPQDLAVRMYNYQLLSGEHAKPVTLEVKGTAGRLRSVTLSREPDPNAKSQPAFAFRMLPGGVAYLALGEFEDNEGAKLFKQHLPQILKSKGLVLDLRDNGGGSSNYGFDILTWLTDKTVPLPSTYSLNYVPASRAWLGPLEMWESLDDPDNTYSSDRKLPYTGPVAVLIGPRTFSAAEDSVVSFEAMKRGVLVGQTTAGSTGQPLMFKLPGGGMARICTLRETFPDRRKFAGKGIKPQIEVAPTVADIRSGHDAAIAVAAKALMADPTPAHK